MKTFQVTLDDETAGMVDKLLEDGPWQNVDELFTNSLGSLQEDVLVDEPDVGDIEEVKRKIQEGIDSADRGDLIDGEEFFAELLARFEHKPVAAAS